ncbi:MAG: sigma-70 family RNA polymerase sigma factor [Oscillospiraceae bacterium]|nr:sigma-70 family RNA polymerase sigma factor [Oscillospiraceae bacterium]
MDKTLRRLENEALLEYITLSQTSGGLGSHVRMAMQEELTDRQRELIEMYYLKGMSMTEIAHTLGLSPSTVSRTLKRGRERIRKHFKYNGRILVNSLLD